MNATYYLVVLIAITITLFVIALLLPHIKAKKTPADLYHLCQLVLSDEFNLQLSNRFISITKNNQTVALLTLDDKLDNHTRKMGNSLIINFKTFPNQKSLEQRLIQDKIIILN